MSNLTVEGVARVAHEANRRYCLVVGDPAPLPWEGATDAARAGYIEGVRFRLAHPDAPPSAQHVEWMESRLAAGWMYGPVKDEAAKTHPNLVPYGELPAAQHAKDALFIAVVSGLRPYIDATGG